MAGLAALLGACAAEPGDAGPGLDRLHWRTCASDAQCAATFLSCRGWEAVRADRVADVQAWYLRTHADMLARSECAGPGDMPRPAALCRAGRCTPGASPLPLPPPAGPSARPAPEGPP